MRTGSKPNGVTYGEIKAENERLTAEVLRLRLRVEHLENQVRAYRDEGQSGLLRCSVCRKVKTEKFFWRDRSTRTGHRSQCKRCAIDQRKRLDSRGRLEAEEIA